MAGAHDIPRVSQDPRDPQFYGNPYDFYRKIRALGDFVFWEDYDIVVATTHVACNAVMKHPKLGRRVPLALQQDRPDHLQTFFDLERNSLLELEPPTHTRLRRATQRGFGRNQIAAFAPKISTTTDALIDAFPSGPFDFIEALARPLPARVITSFFGLPEEMAAQLQDWSNDMVSMYQSRRSRSIEDKAEKAAQEFGAYLDEVFDARRSAPQADFLSDLIHAQNEGALQSRGELLSSVILLLNAGHEASVHTLGHALRLLANHPDRSIALEPTNIAGTVEECLRFAPPLHMFQRYVYENTRILDHDFAMDQTVGCLLGSACQDDSVWPDAQKFDPFRAHRAHIAFGTGLHVCLGAALARLELQIALPAIFSRCPDLAIVDPPQMTDTYHFHGLKRLMVDVRPAAPSST